MRESDMNYKIHATITITRRSLPMLLVLSCLPPRRGPSAQEGANHSSQGRSKTSRVQILSLWHHRAQGECYIERRTRKLRLKCRTRKNAHSCCLEYGFTRRQFGKLEFLEFGFSELTALAYCCTIVSLNEPKRFNFSRFSCGKVLHT